MENEINDQSQIPDSIESYEHQSELNDMKQHADKIIQGIKKLEENDANRAIWELFQNAVDLSSECEVSIELTADTLEFTHNGEPFTPMTLDCLFKQVSSKTLEERKLTFDENEPVGQYGTGFITTHSFGKEIIIDGALAKNDGYIPLEQFVINRYTDNWKELGERIRQLKKAVSGLLYSGTIINTSYPPTTFTYKTLTKHNRDCAEKAIASLRTILPYVMTLNPRLKRVSVKEISGQSTVYQKKTSSEDGLLKSTSISINDITETIYFLKSEDERITVVLPFSDEMSANYLSDELPRLFLYYPLVGTQSFGINYLIHSRHFQPTEPRDGLYLSSENEDNQKEEEANQSLLNQASKMIFDFIKSQSSLIKNPIKLAKVNFKIDSDKPLLNQYFQDLKSTWVNEFKSFPIVETESGNLLPSESIFIHSSLLQSDEAFDSVFCLVKLFWQNTPAKHLVKEWTGIIDEWQLDEIEYIGFKELATKIQEAQNLETVQFSKELQVFYDYLIGEGHGELFNTFKLLPNIKGEFRLLSGLNKNVSLPDVLIEIADVIMPDVPKRHIHSDFQFELELSPYSRKNYTSDINNAVSEKIKDKSLSKDITAEFLQSFIKYCKVVSTLESTSIPIKMVKSICEYYANDDTLIEISTIKEDELDTRAVQRKLIRLFLNDLSLEESEWVLENTQFLKDVLETGSSYYDFEEMFKTLAVFPNQLNELTVQSYLKVDGGIPEEIKDLFDQVVKPDFPIRANLVSDDFQLYLKNKEKRTVRSLTEKIESEFFENNEFASINDHPYKKEILHLIDQIKSSTDYEKYFPILFSKRSSILVELADGEDTFSILSLDASKIKKLAELGRNPDLDEIIKLGQEALIQQQQDNTNFQHKYTIGTHIEKILRESLSALITAEIKAEVKDVQDGQDIVISLDNKPVYFIEVKSRWDVNNSVRMSKNQTLRANEHSSNYSLCSVDMTKYVGENKYEVADIEEIRNLIRFNTDIGCKVIHLIEVLNQANEPNTIHLDGDFRTLVPQTYIEDGMTLNDFETYLISFLNEENGADK
jgi:hypothetical protein